MLGFFIDDERYPEDVTWIDYQEYFPFKINWKVLWSAWDFYDFLRHCTDDGCLNDIVISFDHDIQSYTDNGDEITGYDLVKHLCEWLTDHPNIGIPTVYFHTQNPVGKKNMECYWNNFINSLEK